MASLGHNELTDIYATSMLPALHDPFVFILKAGSCKHAVIPVYQCIEIFAFLPQLQGPSGHGLPDASPMPVLRDGARLTLTQVPP